MLTLSGPTTYYDYHSRGMGLEYLLCEKFASMLGVSLRVEVCRDTAEMVDRLNNGDGDIIAFPMDKVAGGTSACNVTSDSTKVGWLVRSGNTELADTLRNWFDKKYVGQLQAHERTLLQTASVKRHVYAPMLNRSNGIISSYDGLFKKYSRQAHFDWRLMAAQCYQESTFDPKARSWAGACGLMQIMPSTADHLGLSRAMLFDPEQNIAASARYLNELGQQFSDIASQSERCNFVLASYNGGAFHIRDAMALTEKYGGNPHRWSDVSQYVLKLQDAMYYNDPVVKNGYMRGSETHDYVAKIRSRWNEYRGVRNGSASTAGIHAPQKATKKNRYKVN